MTRGIVDGRCTVNRFFWRFTFGDRTPLETKNPSNALTQSYLATKLLTMDYNDLLTPDAEKKPRARHHMLPPPAAVAATSLVDLTVNSPLLVSFRSVGFDDKDHRHCDRHCVKAHHENDSLPDIPCLPGTDCSILGTHREYSLASVTQLSPQRKIVRPFLHPWSSSKENLFLCRGSDVSGFKMPPRSNIDPASLASSTTASMTTKVRKIDGGSASRCARSSSKIRKQTNFLAKPSKTVAVKRSGGSISSKLSYVATKYK